MKFCVLGKYAPNRKFNLFTWCVPSSPRLYFGRPMRVKMFLRSNRFGRRSRLRCALCFEGSAKRCSCKCGKTRKDNRIRRGYANRTFAVRSWCGKKPTARFLRARRRRLNRLVLGMGCECRTVAPCLICAVFIAAAGDFAE